MADPERIQISGGGGGGHFFPALQTSVWSNNNGGGGGGGGGAAATLDPPLISMNMGAFHLSELTGQTFSVVMIISFLLIKTLELDQ